MRKIAIVGAGQAGLLMAFGLLEAGYDVTLFSDRDAETILHGPLPNTAVVYSDGLEIERTLGLNFWDGAAFPAEGMSFDFRGPDGALAVAVHGAFVDGPGQAIDHRTKFHRWLNEYSRRGGRLEIANLRIEDLDAIAEDNDLTIVAGGKGQITRLFARDPVRSEHFAPARRLAGAVLTGQRFASERPWDHVAFCPTRAHIVGGAGEFFSMPFYAHGRGPCRAILFEAVIDGPMDHGNAITDGEAMVRYIKDMTARFAPEDSILMTDIELIDPKAWLRGSFTPEVRKGVGRLPSGRALLGIGDAVVLNDPAGGQGANNASKTARLYIDRILEHGDAPFDETWMSGLFEESWSGIARHATRFTDIMLSPPSQPLLSIIAAASANDRVADSFAGFFNRPEQLLSAIASPASANDFLREITADAA